MRPRQVDAAVAATCRYAKALSIARGDMLRKHGDRLTLRLLAVDRSTVSRKLDTRLLNLRTRILGS